MLCEEGRRDGEAKKANGKQIGMQKANGEGADEEAREAVGEGKVKL